MGAIWLQEPRPASVIGLLVTTASFVLLSWWPKVAVTDEALVVRNLRTHVVPWGEVTKVAIEEQLPELGKFWVFADSWFGRGGGYTGLVIRQHAHRRTVSFALQGRSPFFNIGRREPPWLIRVADEVDRQRHL
jgi:hypothetical protein